MTNKIYNAYRKHWDGKFEILAGKLTDEEAQKAIRGVAATEEDFCILAKQDIEDYLQKEGRQIARPIKLQIKVEYAENEAYLIYLNFVS